MNIKACITAIVLSVMMAPVVAAQGFAGLGTTAEGFARVVPGVPITLPEDFGSHPDYRLEWWYVTANLQTAEGEPVGVQWTLFRQATKPGAAIEGGWSSHEFWMGHAALTTADSHFAAEKLARGGTGQAGATASPFDTWIDDWRFSRSAKNKGFKLKSRGENFSYDLVLTETGPPVKHGENGYSVKSDKGQASYYFSHPFLEVSGTVEINGEATAVTGEAWLDREWSSQPLAADQSGWDWFSLKLTSGERLMLFGLRGNDNNIYQSGSWVTKQGRLAPLKADDIELTPLGYTDVAGRKVPTRWSVTVRSRELTLVVEALNHNSWMPTSIAYWEGPVTATGSHDAVGYLEMTGY